MPIIRTVCTLVVFSFILRIACSTPEFFGGYVTYSLEDSGNDILAHIELTTGWVLGTGPCGPGCNKSDIHSDTAQSRRTITAREGLHYFGNLSSDYAEHESDATKYRDLTSVVQGSFIEKVIAVSVAGQWEQESTKLSFPLIPNKKHEDFNFDGIYWRHLSHQGSNRKWHLQTRIQSHIRSDTNAMNHCPRVMAKPSYRVKLNTTSSIELSNTDKDSDLVRCSKTENVAAGDLNGFPLPGITIHENCTVVIAAYSENNYKDDDWIAILVTVKDLPRSDMTFGPDSFQTAMYAFSVTSLQFAVNIKAVLDVPMFTHPTPAARQEFNLYVGATWKVLVYAQPPENTTIDTFSVMGNDEENYDISAAKDNTDGREHIKYAEVKWSPRSSDVGSHLACVTATDMTGVDSEEQRCFVLNVKDERFNQSGYASNKPYFVHVPSTSSFVECPTETTCVIPIYVMSNSPLRQIHVRDAFVRSTAIGSASKINLDGEELYKADLSFQHPNPDEVQICLQAEDINRVLSDQLCFTTKIIPPDPCLDKPCLFSGVCVSDKDSGTFSCNCVNHYTGTYCQTPPDFCNPNPCGQHGHCFDNIRPYFCLCSDNMADQNDYNGTNCEFRIDNCAIDDPCNGHGLCVDGISNYSCNCFSRYTGEHCENDTCQNRPPGNLECTDAACNQSCSPHGVCVNSICQCSIGFKGPDCATRLGVHSNADNVKFVDPTIRSGSTLVCYLNQHEIQNCDFKIFIETQTGLPPQLTVSSSPALSRTTASIVNKTQTLEGLDNVFSSLISVKGTLHMNERSGHYVCVGATIGADSDKVCVELQFLAVPVTSKTVSVQFINPTPQAHSVFRCIPNTMCNVLLYTTYKTPCNQVRSAMTGVTIQAPKPDGVNACISEVGFQFATEGEHDICFMSADSNYQEICYTADVYGIATDPCKKSPCQNDGLCFRKTTDTFVCRCMDGYTGQLCEKGPCMSNNCQNDGACFIDANIVTCVCKAGFSGQSCETSDSASTPAPEHTGAKFLTTGMPTDLNCNKNRKCGFSVGVVGNFQNNDRPLLITGYISAHIENADIEITQLPAPGSFLSSVSFLPTEVGDFVLCLQTLNKTKINMDELCIQIHVFDGVSYVYGDLSKPHFILPSLQPDSKTVCKEGSSCHTIYTVTPGVGHELACVEVNVEQTDFEHIHVFSSCDPCTEGLPTNGNCTVFVAFRPDSGDSGNKRICLSTARTAGQILGEDRCFNVSVLATTELLETTGGCKSIPCQNGAFCDGHDPSSPVCYCKKEYSGIHCESVVQPTPLSSTDGGIQSTFTGDIGGVPSGIQCKRGEPCIFPFKVCGMASSTATVDVGLVTPNLIVKEIQLNGTSDCKTGTAKVIATETGEHRFCIQSSKLGLVEDEICPVVQITEGETAAEVDSLKPYFLPPTYATGVTVSCNKNAPCYITVHFTDGATFNLPSTCPIITDSSPELVEGVHVFKPEQDTGECKSDITYIVPSAVSAGDSFKLCLTVAIPGKRGEERCFTITVEDDVINKVSGPCKTITCLGESKCVSDLDVNNGQCVCAKGHSGADCSQIINTTKDLPGVINPPPSTLDAPHFDGSSALPKTINCHLGSPCTMSVPYIGVANKPPVPGKCDLNLLGNSTRSLSTTGSSNPPSEHVLLTSVDASPGSHRCCFQTTTNGTKEGVNIDEICFNVEIQPPVSDTLTTLSTPLNSSHPTFSPAMPLTNSSFLCQTDSSCHFSVSTQSNNGQCDQVRQCGVGLPGSHVFKTNLVDNTCVTDISYHTSTPTVMPLCVTAGESGEQRTFLIETNTKNEYGKCQSLHCMNGGTCLSSETEARCQCPPGRTGQDCSRDLNKCDSNPCVRGSCVYAFNSYSCTCDPGYLGTNCEQDVDECESSPCKHGGSCTDLVSAYACDCVPGYTGTNCETDVDECSQVGGNPCQHGSHCVNGVNMYICDCSNTGYTGKNCETDIDECLSTPCLNGGSCSNGANKYTCTCVTGWTGNNCETNVDDCLHHACENGATCVDGVNKYLCSCPLGFTGEHCQKVDAHAIDECTSGPCRNSGRCLDGDHSYTCVCVPGYTGHDCQQDIDECVVHPCLHGGSCVDGINTYTCKCLPGYTGVNCEADIDYCSNSPCKNGGSCTDALNDFSCSCVAGFTDKTCSTNINECASNPCMRGTCADGLNKFTCTCAQGFDGPLCDHNINDCDPTSCSNGGTCIDLVNAHQCTCAAGFTGSNCAIDIDECLSIPCLNGATCTDGIHSYTCACAAGYTGQECEQAVSDCQSSSCTHGGTCLGTPGGHVCKCGIGWSGPTCAASDTVSWRHCQSNACQNGATCIHLVNSYTCHCKTGYSGTNCEIDRCQSNPCLHGGACNDFNGTLKCGCPLGYTGTYCETEINECASGPCQNGGVCKDGANMYTCTCQPGFVGINCELDVDECAASPCGNGATCLDGVNMYTCQCAPGYHGDKCRAQIDECRSSPCVNGGICNDDINKFTCTCPPGYAGTRCEIDVNECTSLPCVHGSTCHDLMNGFLCDCPTGFTGITCQTNIDDCVPGACENGGTCLDGVNAFSCLCANGWRGKRCQNSTQTSPCASLSCRNGGQCVTSDTAAHCVCADGYTGTSCEADINACWSNPCQIGALCTSVGHDYTCACRPGYHGKNCEIDVNECSTSPCKNGGTCVDGSNKFMCNCPPGYTGPLCQIDIDECESMPCQHEGKCTDSVNKYTCTCKQGTAGPNCEHEFNVCASNPCRTGATCVPYQNTFKCVCPNSWEGDRCLYQAERNECSPNPCQNGARCHDDVNDYLCICTSGWTGKDCIDAKDECTPNPCLHSATCTDQNNDYTCACPPGYTGKNCQTNIDDCSSNPCLHGGSCLDLVDNFQCLCTPQYTGHTCQQQRMDPIQARIDLNHQPIETPTDNNPPTFLENGLPEVVRCQVNTTCLVALEVKGKSGLPPSVKPGRQSPGLRVQGIDIEERNPPVCNGGMCVFITSIHYRPTAIGMFNCCVQTMDYKGVNADELCFQIESFPAAPGNPPGMLGTSGGHFLSPSHNSTLACADGRPCTYIIETHKQPGQACADLHETEDGGRVQVFKMAPEGQAGTCKYEVAFTPPNSQTGQHTICLQSETNPDDTLCTKVNVKSSSEIETSMSQCSAVHCEHGFCDSSNSPAMCRCRPGYHGTLCEIASNCSIGSIPKSVTCTKREECSIRFIITGSVDVPAVTPIGDVLTVKLTSDNNDVFTYYTTVHVLRPANTPRVCLNITVADRNRLGKCATSTCIEISYSQVSTSAPNSFPSASPVFDCKAGTDECSPVLLTSQPDPDGSCPLLSVHPESTVENVHLFDSKAVDGRCLTTAVFRPGSGGGHQQLCVTTGSDAACLATDGGNEPCSSGQPTKVREKARKRVKEGYVSCKCLVDDKEVDIIQKKPVPQPRHMVKAASFGAGGMAGTMVVGVIMYLIISRFRKPQDADDLVGMPSVRQVSVRPGSSKPPLSPSPKFSRASSPPHRIHPLLRRQQDNLRPMPKSMDF